MNCEICGKQISGVYKVHLACTMKLKSLEKSYPMDDRQRKKSKHMFSVNSGIAEKNEIRSALLLFRGREALGVSGSACADLLGFGTANIFLNIRGTGATLSPDKNVKITLLHGDTSTGATGAVSSEDLIGATSLNGVVKNFMATPASAAKNSSIEYRGGKRHIRVRYNASGAASAATGANGIRMVVSIIKGNSPEDLFQKNINFIEKEKIGKINNLFSA